MTTLIFPAEPVARVLCWPAAAPVRTLCVAITGVVTPPTGADFDPADFAADDFKTT